MVTIAEHFATALTNNVSPAELSRQSRFDHAFRRYRRWARDNKVKTKVRHKFRAKQWVKKGWPQIGQKVANAAATRTMLYWMHDVCRQHTDKPSDRMRAGMLGHFVRADMVCRRAGRFFSADEQQAYSGHTESVALVQLVGHQGYCEESKVVQASPKVSCVDACSIRLRQDGLRQSQKGVLLPGRGHGTTPKHPRSDLIC